MIEQNNLKLKKKKVIFVQVFVETEADAVTCKAHHSIYRHVRVYLKFILQTLLTL